MTKKKEKTCIVCNGKFSEPFVRICTPCHKVLTPNSGRFTPELNELRARQVGERIRAYRAKKKMERTA